MVGIGMGLSNGGRNVRLTALANNLPEDDDHSGGLHFLISEWRQEMRSWMCDSAFTRRKTYRPPNWKKRVCCVLLGESRKPSHTSRKLSFLKKTPVLLLQERQLTAGRENSCSNLGSCHGTLRWLRQDKLITREKHENAVSDWQDMAD